MQQKAIIVGVALFYSLYPMSNVLSPVIEESTSFELTSVTQSPTNPTVTISFVGDIMLDRYIRTRFEPKGYGAIVDPELTTLLHQSDFVVGNLEGPVTSFIPVSTTDSSQPTHFQFTFSQDSLEALTNNNIEIVSLGNNHTLNFGIEGVRETKQLLEESGISYFGDPSEGDVQVYRRTTHEQTFAFVAHNYADQISDDRTLQTIHKLDPEVDHVIVFAHWGDEYQNTPEESEQTLARRYIEGGADLIIGAHPHVIQSKERYNNRWIYYSLGNFIFDQYFSPEVRCGLLVQVTFTKGSVPVVQNEAFTELQTNGTTEQSTCRSEVERRL